MQWKAKKNLTPKLIWLRSHASVLLTIYGFDKIESVGGIALLNNSLMSPESQHPWLALA